jgi:proteasome accessory factor C
MTAATADARRGGDRLGRLLNLVPYLLARPGILVADAAADLDVSEKQLREDLELLWVCGLPGYGPGDLIDMAFDGDRVTVTYDAGIDRPLRLNHDEALALVVALRMLAQVPGGHSREAVERAPAKIELRGGRCGRRASGRGSACPGTGSERWRSCRERCSDSGHCA